MLKFQNQLKEAMDLKLYREGIQRLNRRNFNQEEYTTDGSTGILNVEISKPDLQIEVNNSPRGILKNNKI